MEKIAKGAKIFIFGLMGALIGSLLFQYFTYGIPANLGIRDAENVESVSISRDGQDILLTDSEEITEAILFTNFLYIKLGKAEDPESVTEYIVRLKDGKEIYLGAGRESITVNNRTYKGNPKYLETFDRVVEGIVFKQPQPAHFNKFSELKTQGIANHELSRVF